MNRCKNKWKQKRHLRRYSSGLKLINKYNFLKSSGIRSPKSRAQIYVGIKGVRRNPPGSVIKPRATIYIRPPRQKKPLRTFSAADFVDIPGLGMAETYDSTPSTEKQVKQETKYYDRFVDRNINRATKATMEGNFDEAAAEFENIANTAKKTYDASTRAKDDVKKEAQDFFKKYNELAKKSQRWSPGERQKAEDDFKRMQKFVKEVEYYNDIEKGNYNLAMEHKDLAKKASLETDIFTAATQKAALLKGIEDYKKFEEARRKAYVESRSMFRRMNFSFPKTFARMEIGGFKW